MGISHIVLLVQLKLSCVQGSCLQGPGDGECSSAALGLQLQTFQKRILEVGGENIQSLSMGMRAGNAADLLISQVSLRQPVWSDCPTDVYLHKIQ